MRVVEGKRVRSMSATEVAAWTAAYEATTIDVGTGDGRFVRHLARSRPREGVVGVDLCQANVSEASRAAGGNALFVLADARALPDELSGVASRVTINFPWGSLLQALLAADPGLLAGLGAVGRGGTVIEIRLNAGALTEAGWTLEAGGARATSVLRDAGLIVGPSRALGSVDLRQWPTTWAKRLAYGREPRACQIEASVPHRTTTPG